MRKHIVVVVAYPIMRRRKREENRSRSDATTLLSTPLPPLLPSQVYLKIKRITAVTTTTTTTTKTTVITKKTEQKKERDHFSCRAYDFLCINIRAPEEHNAHGSTSAHLIRARTPPPPATSQLHPQQQQQQQYSQHSAERERELLVREVLRARVRYNNITSYRSTFARELMFSLSDPSGVALLTVAFCLASQQRATLCSSVAAAAAPAAPAAAT
ncbi:unnamed protein product [Trichogramma brassicae]|uniref:Uncharacterized protein n=1 Tax=Trichogramma brassicae TaxID=86971 RepID=A0A6H5I340_9HYME|nr:unnamed protein product [Trichogramma brassicae]